MSFKDDFSLEKVARLTMPEFNQLSALVYKIVGIHLSPSKKIMLECRLNKRLRALSMPSFGNYISYLTSKEGQQQELIHMIDVVTTNKTDFFREPQHFDFLQNQILPDFAESESVQQFRVWSAACSTGEEPYSLAMVLQTFGENHPAFGYSIFASDISTEVLQKAQLATYDQERVAYIPLHVRQKFLLKRNDNVKPTVRVVPELRKKVRFQRVNLMGNLQEVEGGLDVVFCRNVLIYFDRVTQQQVLSKIIDKLKPKGYLFIGHSESLYQLDLPVVQIKPTVYQKQ